MNNMIIKMMGLAMLAIIGTNSATAQRAVNAGRTVNRTTHVSHGHSDSHHNKSHNAHFSHSKHHDAPVHHAAPHHAHVGYHPTPAYHAPHPHLAAIAPRHHHLPAHVCILPAPRPYMVAGTLVEYLPADCVVVSIGGLQYYMSRGIHYAPILYGGRILYRVV